MASLSGQVACVTGSSRGIGRGIAVELALAGATVYITGRPTAQSDSVTLKEKGYLPSLEATAKEINALGKGKAVAVYCDHSRDDDVKKLFEQIDSENNGRLDILVNNAYAAVDMILNKAESKFWELDGPTTWDTTNNVGLRNHYICSVYAARLMVKRQSGLIVNISSIGGLTYLFNVAYGTGKAACDRMACDMAVELKRQNVAALSLWPGAVKTEVITTQVLETSREGETIDKMKGIFANGETTQFSGRCIVAIASDPKKLKWTRTIVTTADVADYYDIADVDGGRPTSIRAFRGLLEFAGQGWLSSYFPRWFKLPGWVLVALNSRF